MSIKADSVRGRKMRKVLGALNVPGFKEMDKRAPPLVVLCDNAGSPALIVFIIFCKGRHWAVFVPKPSNTPGSSGRFRIEISSPYWRNGEMQKIRDFIFCKKDCGIPCTSATLQTLPLPYFSGATKLVVSKLVDKKTIERIYTKGDDE